jgi:hypothetical protein
MCIHTGVQPPLLPDFSESHVQAEQWLINAPGCNVSSGCTHIEFLLCMQDICSKQDDEKKDMAKLTHH